MRNSSYVYLINNSENSHGTTPLIQAVVDGRTAIVDLLLAAGADTKKQNTNGVSALEMAVLKNNVEVVAKLLRAGASPNITDHMGVTPLMGAAKNGYLESLRLLLATGRANVSQQNCRGMTALTIATVKNQVSAVDLLLYAGADTEVRDRFGYVACDYAMAGGYQDIALQITFFRVYRIMASAFWCWMPQPAVPAHSGVAGTLFVWKNALKGTDKVPFLVTCTCYVFFGTCLKTPAAAHLLCWRRAHSRWLSFPRHS